MDTQFNKGIGVYRSSGFKSHHHPLSKNIFTCLTHEKKQTCMPECVYNAMHTWDKLNHQTIRKFHGLGHEKEKDFSKQV